MKTILKILPNQQFYCSLENGNILEKATLTKKKQKPLALHKEICQPVGLDSVLPSGFYKTAEDSTWQTRNKIDKLIQKE